MSLLQNISKWLLSKKEAPAATKKFLSWDEMKSVLVVAGDNQLSEVVDFVASCEKDNKKVKVAIIYIGKPEQAPKPPFNHVIIDKKQFSFFKLINEAFLQSIAHEKYDVLINLGKEDGIRSLSLSKMIKSTCKISSFTNPIFDITIDVDKSDNSHRFLKQVVVYLQMIKTT